MINENISFKIKCDKCKYIFVPKQIASSYTCKKCNHKINIGKSEFDD